MCQRLLIIFGAEEPFTERALLEYPLPQAEVLLPEFSDAPALR
jgi:hypothetical protein